MNKTQTQISKPRVKKWPETVNSLMLIKNFLAKSIKNGKRLKIVRPNLFCHQEKFHSTPEYTL